jgi:GTPase SAR1 family protein
VIVVYSIIDSASYANVEGWANLAKQFAPSALILIFGNKSDLEAKRCVRADEAEQWCDGQGFSFMEGSAVTGEGIDMAFMTVIQKWIDAGRPGSVDAIIQEKDAAKDGCCG